MSLSSPGPIYLDSSVLIGAAILGSNRSAASRDFCEQLAAERVRICFSQIARYEFAHLAWCLASPEDRRRLPDEIATSFELEQWGSNLEVRQRWLDVVRSELDELLAQFIDVFEVPIRPQFWARTLNLMAHYGLRSYDALHLATAQSYGIRAFATTDRHFYIVDDLDVVLVRDP